MEAIGFRVAPSKVTFAIVRAGHGNRFSVVKVGEIIVPAALEAPRQLQYVRTVVLDVIEEYGVTRAGLRVTEAMAKRKDPFRLNLEGVVQELLASSAVERFLAGPIATMAGALGQRDRTVIKQWIEGPAPDFVEAEWAKLDELQREAVLMAAAAGSVGHAVDSEEGSAL